MRLAEALLERAELQKRLVQLRGRIAAAARYQEGAEPDEDAAALLREAESVVDALESLVARINATNAVVALPSGETLTALLARRDALRSRWGLLTAAADAASGQGGGVLPRQLRSELRMLAALPVAPLRTRADEVARALRELDAVIQRTDWEVDLVE